LFAFDAAGWRPCTLWHCSPLIPSPEVIGRQLIRISHRSGPTCRRPSWNRCAYGRPRRHYCASPLKPPHGEPGRGSHLVLARVCSSACRHSTEIPKRSHSQTNSPQKSGSTGAHRIAPSCCLSAPARPNVRDEVVRNTIAVCARQPARGAYGAAISKYPAALGRQISAGSMVRQTHVLGTNAVGGTAGPGMPRPLSPRRSNNPPPRALTGTANDYVLTRWLQRRLTAHL
jgi:hypothetical protein